MSESRIVTGDDTALTVTCQDPDGGVVNVSAATDIKVAIVKADRSGYLAGPYTCSSGTTGASWSTGVVVASVPGTDTSALTVASGLIECQVIIGGLKTTYLGVRPLGIVHGVIP